MYNSTDIPISKETIEDLDIAFEIGMLPGIDAVAPFSRRWDPINETRNEDVDCGWIGEDAGGIWLKRHPEVELLTQSRLQCVVDEFRCGIQRVTKNDYLTRSNFEIQSKLIMYGANGRRRERTIKGKENG